MNAPRRSSNVITIASIGGRWRFCLTLAAIATMAFFSVQNTQRGLTVSSSTPTLQHTYTQKQSSEKATMIASQVPEDLDEQRDLVNQLRQNNRGSNSIPVQVADNIIAEEVELINDGLDTSSSLQATSDAYVVEQETAVSEVPHVVINDERTTEEDTDSPENISVLNKSAITEDVATAINMIIDDETDSDFLDNHAMSNPSSNVTSDSEDNADSAIPTNRGRAQDLPNNDEGNVVDGEQQPQVQLDDTLTATTVDVISEEAQQEEAVSLSLHIETAGMTTKTPPTKRKKKYRGWAMMHTLKAGGNSVEHMLKAVGWAQNGPTKNSHSLYQHDKRRSGGYLYFEDDVADRLWYEENLAKEAEREGVVGVPTFFSSLPKDEFFKIGMAREPCDYMVSVWAFSGGIRRHRHPHGFLTGRCAGQESVQNFTRFLHETVMPHEFGWLSYRLAAQVGEFNRDKDKRFGTQSCPRQGQPETLARIERKVASFNVAEEADCWVRTENMHGDLQRCLNLYVELQGGDSQTNMTMRNFPKKTPQANKGKHKSCTEYFSDEEANIIWQREGHLARQLGYGGCCQGLVDAIPV